MGNRPRLDTSGVSQRDSAPSSITVGDGTAVPHCDGEFLGDVGDAGANGVDRTPMEMSTEDWRPHPMVLRVTAYAACFAIIGYAAHLTFGLLGQMSIVLFPVVTAIFLMRVLAVPAGWLTHRGWSATAAAVTVIFGFLAFLVLCGLVIVPPTASEFATLGDTVTEGTQQIEDWLVEDSSFDVNRRDIENFKEDVADRSRQTLENSTSTIAQGARLVIEALVGFILALVLTFFFLKDGPRFYDFSLGLLPRRHRGSGAALIRSAWVTLGGYIRGAALLGLLEAAIIGAAMGLTGASLVVPVMLLTFLAAFVPLVGATVAGVLAVVVTLATAGFADAVVVAIVAVLVQQFDNELLAPWIYGKALELHPVVILLSIAAGTSLFGIPGTLLAVPVAGIAINGVNAIRAHRQGGPEPPPGQGEQPAPAPG